jgi:3-methyladenine DNA glycosylase AlkD
MKEIQALLLPHREESYAQFQRKLLPTLPPETIWGVRTPVLRSLAKQIAQENECAAFLQECPHVLFEERQLHGFILSGVKDFDQCLTLLEAFLPTIDNWATCDQTSPKVFRAHSAELLPFIRRWLASPHPYTVRFGVNMLMQHYLDANFSPEYPAWVAGIQTEDYYVRMGMAWYMATALAKQWDAVVPYIEQGVLDKWVHNKTIQKAVESYRLTPAQKTYLKAFRR